MTHWEEAEAVAHRAEREDAELNPAAEQKKGVGVPWVWKNE